MSEEPDNLVLRLLQEIRTELASLRDDMNVLTAIVQRLDNSHTRLLGEIRTTQSPGRHVGIDAARRARLEGLVPSDPP